MKKCLIMLFIFVFAIPMIFIGTGCKEEVVEEEVEEAVEEVEEAAEEVEEVKPRKLTVWWWGETDAPGLEAYLEDSIEIYEASNPGVTVEQILQSTEDTIPAFNAAAAAQEGPDIACLWYGVYQLEAVWAGNVEPLDNLIDSEETDHWITKEFSTWDNKLWASDFYVYGVEMIYNKEIFTGAGLDPEKPPATWDEFLSACEKIKDIGIRPIAAGFKSPGWETAMLAQGILPQTISSKDIMDAGLGIKSFTDPEWIDLFTRIDYLNKKGYFLESALEITSSEGRIEWRAGNAAFALAATQMTLQWYEELGSEKMGVMPFPSITGTPVDWISVAPISLFVTKWSPNKELAADFLKFLHSEERMNAMYEQLKGAAIPADDRFDVDIIADPLTKSLAEKVLSGSEKGTWFTEALLPWGIIADGVMLAGQKLIVGDFTPEEAAQFSDDAAQAWREQNPETLEKFMMWNLK